MAGIIGKPIFCRVCGARSFVRLYDRAKGASFNYTVGLERVDGGEHQCKDEKFCAWWVDQMNKSKLLPQPEYEKATIGGKEYSISIATPPTPEFEWGATCDGISVGGKSRDEVVSKMLNALSDRVEPVGVTQ